MKALFGLVLLCAAAGIARGSERNSLDLRPYTLIYESYVNGNWELFTSKGDGSEPKNLTETPDRHELYPQVSPDGSRISFVSDEGEGRDTVRSVYYMDLATGQRTKVADHARQPFWRADGKVLGYLPQEYPKFNVVDYSTSGIMFYDLATKKSRAHTNTAKIHHLYNPNFSPDGRWIVATVHAGMGFDHAILLIESEGNQIFNLGIPGCRPTLSPDGKEVAWGPGDHELAVAPIDWEGNTPKVGPKRIRILDEKLKIYHIDWSPDGRFLSFSRGPDGEGDPRVKGTHRAACEIVGVYAPGWNIFAMKAQPGTVDLTQGAADSCVAVTTNGLSNKESAWLRKP